MRPGTPRERVGVLVWVGREAGREGKGGEGRGGEGRGREGKGGQHPFPLPSYLVFEVRLCTVFPLLKHIRQLVQATVVEVEHLVLAFPTGDDQLATGAGLIAERPLEGGREQTHEYVNTGFYFQV